MKADDGDYGVIILKSVTIGIFFASFCASFVTASVIRSDQDTI